METVLDPSGPSLSDNHQFLNVSLSPANEKWEEKRIFNKSQNFWKVILKRFELSPLSPMVGYNDEDLQNPSYRVIFLTGPPLKMSLDWPPPNLLGLAPP